MNILNKSLMGAYRKRVKSHCDTPSLYFEIVAFDILRPCNLKSFVGNGNIYKPCFAVWWIV